MPRSETQPPSAADIERIADREYHRIPAFLRAKVDPVMIRVVEFPSDEVREEMELESPSTCSASIRVSPSTRAVSTTCARTLT